MQTARNTMGGDRPRNPADAYYTPDPLALAICRRLRETIGEVDLIVEPSAGEGAFVRAARGAWGSSTQIAALDPNTPTQVFADAGADQAQSRRWEDAGLVLAADELSLILGNPPYLLAESHVRIALERLGHFDATEPQPRYLAFLLRASFLAGLRRTASLWADAPPRYVWHVAPRPSFTGGGTDGAEYAVIVWQAGWRGPNEGGWLRWER